ncbi:hypothetical protein T459_11954 [Capsicum annuum]|uniref:Uncharacterized protein n=1 Tax=Capsicum annuum TaxID=4072 RepID=A0A2G2ZNI4_CAPAN|nr:hypothetical protein T459_11954 [Capsicum annuum]
MDEILKNIYSNSNPFASNPTVTFTVTTVVAINSIVVVADGGGGGDVVLNKTVDEVLPDEGNLQLVNFTSSVAAENSRIYLAFQLNTEMPRSLYNNAKKGAETHNFKAREVEVNDLQAAVVQYLQFRGTGKVKNLVVEAEVALIVYVKITTAVGPSTVFA